MSLMFNALKRLESKPAGRTANTSTDDANIGDHNVSQTAILPEASDRKEDAPLAQIPFSDCCASLDGVMDQIQAFVAEAGLLYDTQPDSVEAEPTPPAANPIESPSDIGPRNVEPPQALRPFVPPTILASVPNIEDEAATVMPLATFCEMQKEQPAASSPQSVALIESAYAELAGRILSQLSTDRGQVILFTSACDGQGKSSTVAQLASCLAEKAGRNILVVDANFRNPDMARRLDIVPARTLADVLRGRATWREAVRTTADDRVSLLPGAAASFGDILSQTAPTLPVLLRDLAQHYALVLVDAGSLSQLGAAEMVAACDATYLIVRLGDGSPRILREAVQVIAANGGRLAGCIAVEA